MARNSTGKTILIIANVILLVLLAGATAWLFMENRDLKDQLTLTSEEKNERLVAEINKVFDLPDETPVVAKVTDADDFKKQFPVFDNAEMGDYLLVFRKARLNVLYRESEKRVVKTAPITAPIAVEIFGSKEAIAQAEKDLTEFGKQIAITKTEKDGITQSFVYDVGENQKAEAESIAKQLGYEVGTTLPSSITPTEQSEIVVVAADKGSSKQAEDSTQEP